MANLISVQVIKSQEIEKDIAVLQILFCKTQKAISNNILLLNSILEVEHVQYRDECC